MISACVEKRIILEQREQDRKNFKRETFVPTGTPYIPEKGLVCWWCVHDLPQRPCFHLPIKYDDKRKTFTTIGNFCSWACAKAYAVDMRTARSGEIQSFLALMRKQAYGKTVPLWPAPKREALACFGGSMTIEEFRSFNGVTEPPHVHFPFEKYQTVSIGSEALKPSVLKPANTQKSTAIHLHAIENSTTETDTLRLRRTKPLVRATSTLENSLGIKRKEKSRTESSVAAS